MIIIVTLALCVTSFTALAFALILNMCTAYYTRQRWRIIARLPEEPKPWYVRVFERIPL